MQRIQTLLAGSILAAALATATACGGGAEAPVAPSGRAMDGGASPSQPAEQPAQAAVPAGGSAGGEAPVVRDVRLSPREPAAGVAISAIVEADDPDGDLVRLSYSWKLNGRVVREGGDSTITLNELGKGDELVVEVVANDGFNQSAPMRARARVSNRVPMVDEVAFQPAGTPRAGDIVIATPMARDPDGDDLRFKYEWFVNGVSKGQEREFSTQGLRRGDRLSVKVIAMDGATESRAFTSRTIALGNTPPRITRLPDVQTDSGVFSYQFEAFDADGDRNLRFFLDKSPDGMTVDGITGLLTWKPSAGQAGVHPVEIGVLDSEGEGTTFAFEVTVKAEQAPASAAD